MSQIAGRPGHAIRAAFVVALCLGPPIAGCASYQIGQQSLYRSDIRTIHVVVFESESFRRGLGEWLTEAVIRQLQQRTSYQIADADSADSILTGRIVNTSKQILAETINDDPRNIEFDLNVEFAWRDRQGLLLSNPFVFSLPPTLIDVAQGSSFIPEGGQSVVSTEQRVIEQLAEQIVSQMEIPW